MSKGRVCLAYSGGLDTSTILVWLLQQGYQVVCYLGDVGQDEDFAAVEAKALKLGAEAFVCENLQRELVDDVVSRAIMCNAIFEDQYLLGTALARPIIARSMIRVAEKHNCAYLSHGATGKGPGSIRGWSPPVTLYALMGRNDLLKFAAENNIPVSSTPKAPWSMDENIIHTSYEAGILEDPDHTPPKELWMRTKDPQDAPNEPTEFSVHFEKGLISKVVVGDKEVTDSVESLKLAMRMALDELISWRTLTSALYHSTPGLTLARLAHLSLEGLVMDGRVRELRDQFSSITWSRLIYNGMYFSPEREFVENSVVFCQHNVTGVVRLSAYKGHAYVLGRSSNASNLYSEQDASMDSLEGFSPMDTTGFIAIQAIRLKKYGEQKIKDGQPLSKS
ncbi:argininosuccinate synthase, partial [Metarhizium brunneum ARSEF 3297]